jgi:hypothetical protein
MRHFAPRSPSSAIILVFTLLATAVRAAEPVAAKDTPHIDFVREYIRELGELERLRARVAEVLQAPGADHMTEMIGYSTRVQIAMRSYIGLLNNMRLEPPHDVLVTNIVALHNSRFRVHGRIAEISAAMLAEAKNGVDASAMADEAPRLRAVLDEIDGLFPAMSVLAFTTLILPTPDASGETSRLRITAAERETLLESLKVEFGDALDAKSRNALTSAAAVLRGYLRKDFTPADG